MKTIIFTVVMAIISALLFLLKTTGMNIHILLGILGFVVTVGYTLMIKKDFKKLSKISVVSEILMRIFYAVALISGFMLKVIEERAVVAKVHKIAAVIFTILLVVISIKKLLAKKQKED